MRESTRVGLPSAVHLAFADGNTTCAYATGIAWFHLNRAQKVDGSSLISVMIGGVLDLAAMATVEELLSVAPPDRETARKLYDALDPDLMERERARKSANWSG